MPVRELTATYRQVSTPAANLCLVTSFSTALVAGLAAVVDKLITPWPIASGMLVVSGFYLLLGAACLVQQGIRSDRFAAAMTAGRRRSATILESLCSDDCPDDERSATSPARSPDDQDAIAEACQWAG